MWDSESESVGGRDHIHHQYGSGALSSTANQGLKTAGFEQRGQSWFVTTDIASDLLVQIGDVNFHLHKYPLMSRCGKVNRMMYESSNGGELMKLDDLPGGSDAFELAAKFCYGIAIDLTASNISGLRCASEFLEMTEDLEEGNLIFKTEAFLSYVVLSSWRDSILVLKSCEQLSPWAENLQIVRRCSESIAWKACANPKGIRWPYTLSTADHDHTTLVSPSHRSQTKIHHQNNQVDQIPPPDWWFEDVSILRIDHLVRVITAIKVKGMRADLIGASIMQYASKWLSLDFSPEHYPTTSPPMMSWKKDTGLHMIVAGSDNNKTNNKLEEEEDEEYHQARDQRMIIESLISIIPQQKDSVTCTFLLRLLRMANKLKVAPALVTELEKRVGMQFEQATLPDLLVPCYHDNNNTNMYYDTDLMRRLLEHFLVQEQMDSDKSSSMMLHELMAQRNGTSSKARVARIVDSYLTEVAKDRNLSLTKFLVLAETLPDSARTCDDGLYRAIDSYLKAHPTLSEHERKRLCRAMNCQKLSVDARMHAAQNERLPLRVVVQVLFSEQLNITNAIANNQSNTTINQPEEEEGRDLMSAHHHHHYQISNPRTLLEGAPQSFQEGWAGAKKDINTLKFDLQTLNRKYVDLQNQMDTLQKQFDKLAKHPNANKVVHPPPSSSSAWATGWKKLSKFTKMTAVEGQELGTRAPNDHHTRKTQRRWRNSIS